MKTVGFDNALYIQKQSEEIRKRIDRLGGKLYLEFGGKLFDDFHASRVLPGFAPDSKIQMLKAMADQAEIIIAISATDIEKNTTRGDLGITYDADVLRLIDAFREFGLYVGSVVITRYENQPAAKKFQEKLENLGLRVYRHYTIPGYPANVARVVSDEGLGKNEYVETTRPLAVVTAPGPGSGKMAVCLSQMYHEYRRGSKAGYAKFETFPVWNLPLKHPVNLAYEAATANLNDVNMIDPWHLAAYGTTAVNYNRDVEVFPVLQAILDAIGNPGTYRSPTDMGVNMVGSAIVDDEVCCEASRQEVLRRYYQARCDLRKGTGGEAPVNKIELVMKQVGITTADRPVVAAALARAEETGKPAVAIELPDGRVVTGKTSDLLGPSAAALLNAAKAQSGLSKETLLIAKSVIEPVQKMKTKLLGNRNPRLHSDEVLVALAVSASMNEDAKRASNALPMLRGCQAHSTVILSQVDADIYRKLGMHLTCEPNYQTKKLYHK